jgi:hypothetical protein
MNTPDHRNDDHESARETAATVRPADSAVRCREDGCERDELLARVKPANGRERVLCPRHRVEYLREVSINE